MCSECHQTPCAVGCPNFVPRQVYVCEHCGEAICEGEAYIDFEGTPYHQECIENIAYRLLCESCDVREKTAR